VLWEQVLQDERERNVLWRSGLLQQRRGLHDDDTAAAAGQQVEIVGENDRARLLPEATRVRQGRVLPAWDQGEQSGRNPPHLLPTG
jgi:hypothetical protein